MIIKYWNAFSKKKNSTKIPLDSNAQTISKVRLKNNTSITNPVFEISTPNLLMSYIQWEGRYYFVEDVILRHDTIYEVKCSIDVLASHKTEIGNYTAYVERSASSYDPMLYDVAISKKEDSNVITKATTSLGLSGSGTYVVRCVGVNSIQAFVLDESQFYQLINFAFTETSTYPAGPTAVLSGDIVKALFNPFQYIVSVMWFPFSSIFALGSGTLSLGWYDTGISASFIRPDSYAKLLQVTLSKPAETYGDFRDYSNDWSNYALYVPGAGQIQLDASIMKDNTICLNYAIDLITGIFTCQVSTGYGMSGDPDVISSLSGTMGVPVQIGQQGSVTAGVVSGITSAGISAATGNVAGAAITGVNTLGNALQPSVSMSGSQGTMAAIKFWDQAVITKTTKKTSGIPQSTSGRPLYQNVKINTLSGYIQCAHASVDLACYGNEKDQINSYLNSGFYYE